MMISYALIEKKYLSDVINLRGVENWSSYIENLEITWRVLTTLGVTTIIAIDSDTAVGLVQLQSDCLIQTHLSLILVDNEYRRQGIGTGLIKEAFAKCGGKRINLTTDDMPYFYRSFNHKEWFGFRIHPQYD
jgi:GNAT superfamily N-acetyltransferase